MLIETLLAITTKAREVSCAPSETMTGGEFFLLLVVAIGCTIIGFSWGYNRMKVRQAEGYEDGVEKGFKKAFEDFDEQARHQHMLTVMTTLSDMTGGHIYLPRSDKGFKNVWREVEFRYRNWVKDQKSPFWKDPPPVKVKDAN